MIHTHFHFTKLYRALEKLPAEDHIELVEAITIIKDTLMTLNEALDAALKQAEADKKTIATLKDEVAAVPAVNPVKAKALADAVLGADSATLAAPTA